MKNLLLVFVYLISQNVFGRVYTSNSAVAINEDVRKQIFDMISNKMEACLINQDKCTIKIKNKELASLAEDYFSLKFEMLNFSYQNEIFTIKKRNEFKKCLEETAQLVYINRQNNEAIFDNENSNHLVCLGYKIRKKIPFSIDVPSKDSMSLTQYNERNNYFKNLSQLSNFKFSYFSWIGRPLTVVSCEPNEKDCKSEKIEKPLTTEIIVEYRY